MSSAVRFLFAVPSAVLLAACSEAVPPPSSGAFDLQFQGSSNVPGKSCNIQTHPVKVGAVTAAQLVSLLKDTVNDTTVSCSVTGDGAFHVSAYIRQDPSSVQIDVPSVSAANNQANPATGFLSVTSATTQKPFSSTSEQPCNFFLSGTAEQVLAGRAWLSFACPVVADVGTDKYCAIQTGVIAVQDCDQ
ncbi:MAG: hypothetical protein IT373_23925 [Polyangiaceae bacterium]|nr:hypothetical protein [Polyangiaceae bacterium]